MSTVARPRRGRPQPPTASEILRDRARRATESMTTNLQGGNIRYRLFMMFFVVMSLLGVLFVRVAWFSFVASPPAARMGADITSSTARSGSA